MIDYNAFHNYLVELVGMYQRTRSTKGMSQLAQKWHCTAITRDQFYQMKLDKLQPQQVTQQLSRVVRDTIGRSDAKQTLRETIGALNEGILSGSRISQGSDRTVQITITQPMQEAVAVAQQQTQQPQTQQPQNGFTGKLPLYRPGQVLYRKGGMMHLVSRLLDGDRFTWDYELYLGENGHEYINENTSGTSSWMGNQDLRPAKGNEVARFLGALTRSGYEWTADNANGLFFVKQKQQLKRQKPVEVFANDIPLNDYDNTAIHSLPVVSPSPFRFALGPLIPTDNGDDYMTRCHDTQMLNAVVRQVRTTFPDFDHIRELFLYDMPTLCCSEEIKEYRVALVKDANNGTCYWLARDRDVLRLLSWVSYII